MGANYRNAMRQNEQQKSKYKAPYYDIEQFNHHQPVTTAHLTDRAHQHDNKLPKTNDIAIHPPCLIRNNDTAEEEFRFHSPYTPEITTTDPLLDRRIVKRLYFRRDRIFSCFEPGVSIYELSEEAVGDDFRPDALRYHADIAEFRRNRPDLTLRSGDGQTLAVACFRWSRDVKMRYCKEESEVSLPVKKSWDEMRNVSGLGGHSLYRFSVGAECVERSGAFESSFVWDVPSATTGLKVKGSPREFVWRRTRSTTDGVTWLYGKLTCRNYKLVDSVTGEKVAVYLEGSGFKSMRTTGELRIMTSPSEEFEVMIVLSCLAIWEKGRRRIKRYGHGAQ